MNVSDIKNLLPNIFNIIKSQIEILEKLISLIQPSTSVQKFKDKVSEDMWLAEQIPSYESFEKKKRDHQIYENTINQIVEYKFQLQSIITILNEEARLRAELIEKFEINQANLIKLILTNQMNEEEIRERLKLIKKMTEYIKELEKNIQELTKILNIIRKEIFVLENKISDSYENLSNIVGEILDSQISFDKQQMKIELPNFKFSENEKTDKDTRHLDIDLGNFCNSVSRGVKDLLSSRSIRLNDVNDIRKIIEKSTIEALKIKLSSHYDFLNIDKQEKAVNRSVASQEVSSFIKNISNNLFTKITQSRTFKEISGTIENIKSYESELKNKTLIEKNIQENIQAKQSKLNFFQTGLQELKDAHPVLVEDKNGLCDDLGDLLVNPSDFKNENVVKDLPKLINEPEVINSENADISENNRSDNKSPSFRR